MAIDLGDLYRLSMTLTSPAGGLVNADTMTLTITLPDDTTVPTVVAPASTGHYQYDYLTTQPGRHVAHWVGTGTNPGAYVDIFDVRTASPGYLVSLATMKNQLNLNNTTASDEDLRDFIESATDAVERIRNEAVIRRTFVDEIYLPEYFRGIGQVANSAMPYGIDTARFRVAISHTPALSLTSVARVDGTMTWDVANLHLDPAGIIDVMFGPTLVGHIAVTYVAGYRIVPESFTKAAEFIVQNLWQTRRGVKGGPRVGGTETTMVPGIGFAIPNQAMELLGGGMPGMA
jgi:hypothetical protein